MTRIYDDAGRYIGDEPDAPAPRPMGPWDANAAPIVICAWCPDFNPRDERNRGASHGICPTCAAKMDAQLAAKENK